MAGIAGIVNFRNGIELSGGIDRMLDCLKHEPWYESSSFCDRQIALGKSSLGVIDSHIQPVFNHDRSLAIVMHGEIFHYRGQHANLWKQNDNSLISILNLYQKEGDEFVKALNGSFVLAIWDFEKKSLTIANDRYGLRPLYFFRQEDLLVFSSEVKSILALDEVSRRVDERAIAEFFSFEFILGNKTLFRDVSLLPPASVLTFESGDFNLRQYWTLRLQEQGNVFKVEESLKTARKLLCQAVSRQANKDESIALFLSGGLDSRTLLAALTRAGKDILTITYGTPDSYDVKMAQFVAKTLKAKNCFFELDPSYLDKWGRKGVWLTDGMNSCFNFTGIEVLPEVRNLSRIMLNGFGGNELLGHLSWGLFKFSFIRNRKKFIAEFFRTLNQLFPRTVQPLLFKTEFYSQIRGLALESLEQSIDESGADHPYNRIYHFFIREKARRSNLLGLIMDHSQVEYRAPFYDYDFVDFIETIPPQQRRLARFYRQLIVKEFPEVSSIPYQRSGLPVTAGSLRILTKRGLEILHDRIREKVFSLPTAPRRSYTAPDQWMRRQLKDFVVDTLSSDRAKGRRYFNNSYVKRMVELHLSGKHNFSGQLGILLTFELWNRIFIEKERIK